MSNRAFLIPLLLWTLGLSSLPSARVSADEVRFRELCSGTWVSLCLGNVDAARSEFDQGLVRTGINALNRRDVNDLFLAVLEGEVKYGVSYKLLTSIAVVESSLSRQAISSRGAVGLLQILPETAVTLWPRFLATLSPRDPLRRMDPVKDIGDVRLSILLGAFYLSRLQNDFNGSQNLALASYYVGPAALKRALKEGEIYLGSTYVKRVHETLKNFFGDFSNPSRIAAKSRLTNS